MQGKNIHGRIGLFPMNHTSYSKPILRNKSENNTNSFYSQMVATPNETLNSNNSDPNTPLPLFRMPTPSIEETIDDIQNKLRKMSIKTNERPLSPEIPDSLQYQWSPKQSRRSNLFSSSSRSVSSFSTSSHRQSTPNDFLPSPRLSIQTKDHPSTWDVRQVCRWLDEAGFDNDITGDVLLELHLSTLKELNVISFGKRVHIMNAINALKAKYSIGVGPDDDTSDIDEQPNSVQTYAPTPVYRFQPKYNSSSPALGRHTVNEEFRKFPGLPLSPRSSAGNHLPHSAYFTQLKQNLKIKGINLDHLLKNNEITSQENLIRSRPSSPSFEKSRGLRNSVVESPKQSLDITRPESPFQSNKWETLEDLNSMDLEVLKSMGEPDYEGWLKKQGDKYKTWKSRYFILKGVDLYYLKNNKDIHRPKLKGHIDLTGYRVFTDENIFPGKYGFKIVHDVLRTHFFAHEDIDVMKGWVKAMMKATISRDLNAPVISSSNINTVPLADARKMSPRPPQPRRPSFSATTVISKIESPVLRAPSPTYIKEKPNAYITTMGSSSTPYIQ
ncbi:2193_t:CDS:2, partial [Gigaspora margarita]